MTCSNSRWAANRPGWIGTAAMLAAVLVLGPVAQAWAAAPMPAAAQQCLTCHSMPALSKTLGDGEKLALHVPKEAFADSVHAMMGCAGCHRDIDPKAHPSKQSYESERDYTLAKQDSCRSCHSAKYGQYENSIHHQLVQSGNPDAPVCSSCHDVHGQQKVAAHGAYSGTVCQTCHANIFEAYQGSVHGLARVNDDRHAAPICADCHSAHDVTAVSAGDRLTAVCIDCHEDTEGLHRKWLPNSGLHLGAIACAACHSPEGERVVDLRLYDRNSGTFVNETLENPRFVALAQELDVAGDGLDPLELWKLVREARQEGLDASITLRGRMEVRGADAHQLALKAEAVRDCDTCHQKGAAPFENVTISVAGEDGRRIRYEAGKDTLTSAVSVDAISNFYTAGGTRIGLLDGLLALALMAGVGIPVTHWSVRKWFKSKN